MTNPIQTMAREVLRGAGPLTVDQVLAPLAGRRPLSISPNPKQRGRNALTNDPAVQSTGDGRYVYLPSFVRGAGVRMPMDLVAPERGLLVVDAILLSCLDGEAGQYAVKALRTADLNAEEVSAGNTRGREAAAEVVKRMRAGIKPVDLAYRLLARGIYHGEAAPDALREVLPAPWGQFLLESMQITYRPELTPTLRRLFAPRLSDDPRLEDGLLRESLGLPLQPEPEPRADLEPEPEEAPPRPAERGYRIKVTLQARPGVWRVIEMLDNQTLENLHYAIQEAFGWDDDHLYAFFLSGRAWDTTTEVDRPFRDEDAEPPLANQVTLADLEPVPGQRFLYIFDFGDELRHDIEVLEPFPLPARGRFPRISERHGKAPAQYREWD